MPPVRFEVGASAHSFHAFTNTNGLSLPASASVQRHIAVNQSRYRSGVLWT